MNRSYHLGTLRRFLTTAAVAFWLGGFTFYAGVVIPIGMRVLGSHLRQGFITQQVTLWINVAGACAIPVLCWNTTALWGRAGRIARYCLIGSLIVLAAIQLELFLLHPLLDRLLDVKARQIIDDDRFDLLHRVYLLSSTLQWGIGVFHVLCLSAIRAE